MIKHHQDIDLSIIIVNYNVQAFLEALLRSVFKSKQNLQIEVIVVDNHSSDGSVEMIRKAYPQICLIVNDENSGFASANNQALQCYRGRYACLVNPDVLLQEDTLETMVSFMDQHPDVGAAGCKVLNPDGSLQLACRRKMPTPSSAFFKLSGLSRLFPQNRIIGAYNMTYLDPDINHDVDAISGSFMVVRRETIEEVGPLDDRFFMYGEDLDWLFRMGKNGWRVCYVPETRIVHYKGESSKISSRQLSIEFYRAMYLFSKKHRTGYGLQIMTLLIQGLITSGIVIKGSTSFLVGLIRQIKLPLLDLCIINTTPLIATMLRIGRLTPLDEDTFIPYLVVHGTYSIVWLSSLFSMDTYGVRRYSASAAAIAIILGFVIIAAITFFTPTFAFSRAVVLLALMMNLILIGGWRWIVGRLIGAQRRTIIMGSDKMARAVHIHMKKDLSEVYQVIGFLDSDQELIGTKIQDIEVYNGNGYLADTLDHHHIDEVIVASNTIPYQDILHLISACTRLGIGLKLVSDEKQDDNQLKTFSLVEVGQDPFASIKRIIRRGLPRSR
jgi:O-antigen biosynthesis protein